MLSNISAKILACANMKGGVGKTSVLVNIAGVLSENQKVLVIDADPQANASSGLGVDIAVDRLTIANIFEKDVVTNPEDVVIKAPIPELSNLDLLPSSITLAVAEFKLAARGDRERILTYYMQDNADFFNQYDYILIDTNPSMGIVNQNSFLAADSIILVADVSMNAMMGVEIFDYLWELVRTDLRKENNIGALVINNLDKRIGLSKDAVEYCRDHEDLSKLLVEPFILSRVAYKDTEIEATPINVIHRNKPEHKAYKELIEALKGKGVL